MRAKVWIFPGAMAQGQEPVWQSPPPGLRQLASQGEVLRVGPLDSRLAVLGLDGAYEAANGPLIAAALKIDPPERSVCFELTLLSVDAGGIVGEVGHLSPSELAEATAQFPRLATKTLTPVPGEHTVHALVWERGSLDIHCQKVGEVLGGTYTRHLPQGDGEPALRQLIDDSLNLLDGLEFNRIREGEGMPKANLLWPHSFGFMPKLPNLALARGESATLHSDSLYASGLANLAGYRHAPRQGFRDGIHVSESAVAAHASGEGTDILIDQKLAASLDGRAEEAEFALGRFDRFGWEPLAESISKGAHIRAGILCPGGLGLLIGPSAAPKHIPFDARALDEPRLRSIPLAQAVANLLSPSIG